MIDKDFKRFYLIKNNHPLEKKVCYRLIGLISFFSYLFVIVGILSMNETRLYTEMWIIISLVILEKLGFLIYFYTHRQYSKWYYHIIWELLHFDPDYVNCEEVKANPVHINANQQVANNNHNNNNNINIININNNNNNNNNIVQNINNNNNHQNNNNNNNNQLNHNNNGQANNQQKINRYNLKIPLNLMASVVFHYSALTNLQNSDQTYEVQMKYMIISLILLFANQVLLFQRLYFRNLINLHQFVYMVAEGVAYQYSQLSLLALIQEVGNKWYVYIIAFIFAAVSLSMILERNTHLYFTESLIYLMLSQVFGLRLEAEFLYSKHNDRCQKIFSYIMYGCFSIAFWIALVLLVIIYGGSKLYYLNYSIPIALMATAFFFLFQVMIIVRYIWKSPLRISKQINSLRDLETIENRITPITKIIDLCIIQNNNSLMISQQQLQEETISFLLFKNKEILYNFTIWNHQKEQILTIESIYDSQKIRVFAIKMVFENIAQLELVCTQLEKQQFNYYEFIVNIQNIVSVKNQAIYSLLKYPMVCVNLYKSSNVIRTDESFHNYCIYLRQNLHQIYAMHKHIQGILVTNPRSVFYDLFDE